MSVVKMARAAMLENVKSATLIKVIAGGGVNGRAHLARDAFADPRDLSADAAGIYVITGTETTPCCYYPPPADEPFARARAHTGFYSAPWTDDVSATTLFRCVDEGALAILVHARTLAHARQWFARELSPRRAAGAFCPRLASAIADGGVHGLLSFVHTCNIAGCADFHLADATALESWAPPPPRANHLFFFGTRAMVPRVVESIYSNIIYINFEMNAFFNGRLLRANSTLVKFAVYIANLRDAGEPVVIAAESGAFAFPLGLALLVAAFERARVDSTEMFNLAGEFESARLDSGFERFDIMGAGFAPINVAGSFCGRSVGVLFKKFLYNVVPASINFQPAREALPSEEEGVDVVDEGFTGGIEGKEIQTPCALCATEGETHCQLESYLGLEVITSPAPQCAFESLYDGQMLKYDTSPLHELGLPGSAPPSPSPTLEDFWRQDMFKPVVLEFTPAFRENERGMVWRAHLDAYQQLHEQSLFDRSAPPPQTFDDGA